MKQKTFSILFSILSLISYSTMSFAQDQSSGLDAVKQIISELKNVLKEKEQIGEALKHAEKHQKISAIIGVTGISLVMAMGASQLWADVWAAKAVESDLIAAALHKPALESFKTPAYFLFIENNTNAIYVTLSATLVGSAATSIYFQIEAKNYQKAIDVLNADIESLTKKLIALETIK